MAAVAEYSVKTQAKIPAALAALHNFIWIYDPDDLAEEDDDSDNENHIPPPEIPIIPENLGHHITTAEWVQAAERHVSIAKAMWEDYVGELQRCGI